MSMMLAIAHPDDACLYFSYKKDILLMLEAGEELVQNGRKPTGFHETSSIDTPGLSVVRFILGICSKRKRSVRTVPCSLIRRYSRPK